LPSNSTSSASVTLAAERVVKRRRPRKLTKERAAALNRKRDLLEGHEANYEVDRVRALPGRGRTERR